MSESLDLGPIADRLLKVSGVQAVMLGGSRARGDHRPDSDYDLGLYYRPPFDVAALGALARELAGSETTVSVVGGWGPWVDGGGWLNVGVDRVDWIYRDLGRVQQAWIDAQAGRFAFHRQPGHPLGVPDFAYVGEVGLGVVLADPTGELVRLKNAASHYPEALATALVDGLWEAEFELSAARKGVARRDAVWLAGVLFHALLLCAHALHGAAGRWLINEKGAIAAAGRLGLAPKDFSERAGQVVGRLGRLTPDELEAAISDATALVAEVRQAVG